MVARLRCWPALSLGPWRFCVETAGSGPRPQHPQPGHGGHSSCTKSVIRDCIIFTPGIVTGQFYARVTEFALRAVREDPNCSRTNVLHAGGYGRVGKKCRSRPDCYTIVICKFGRATCVAAPTRDSTTCAHMPCHASLRFSQKFAGETY